MNQRPSSQNSIQRFSQKNNGYDSVPFRRPMWLAAANYYILATAVAVVFFFFVWAIFQEGGEETPWVSAGFGAVFIFGGAIIFREIYLRKARNRFLAAQRKLDYNLKHLQLPARLNNEENKISLEKNAAMIKAIQKKSEAARLLGKISSGHLEVFETCSEYLAIAEKQMETVRAGSPRLAGLRRGREIVGEIHRYHLLIWAEIESRSLTQKAKNYVTISEKINTAQEALTILDSALQFYPNEPQLTESETVLKNFIASIRVSHWIEQAERAAFKGNQKRAMSLYRDALFFLAREDVKNEERDAIAANINLEIELLRQNLETKEINKGFSRIDKND